MDGDDDEDYHCKSLIVILQYISNHILQTTLKRQTLPIDTAV